MRWVVAVWLLIASILLLPNDALAARRSGKVGTGVSAPKPAKSLAAAKASKQAAKAAKAANKQKALTAQQKKPDKVAQVSKAKYPQSAKHIEEAQKAGKPNTITISRTDAKANRRAAMQGTPVKAGKDRDEYPPAFSKEGGKGASVKHIDPKDNRGAGACIGHQCRDVPDGGKVQIEVTR